MIHQRPLNTPVMAIEPDTARSTRGLQLSHSGFAFRGFICSSVAVCRSAPQSFTAASSRSIGAWDRMSGVAQFDSAVDLSLLDVPRETKPVDADAYLRAAMAWHFGADTGSPFWLGATKDLDFDPLTDVGTFTDLRLFPNLTDQLRSCQSKTSSQGATARRRPSLGSMNPEVPPARPSGPRNCRTGSSRSPAGRSRTSPPAASSMATDCCA
jgi:hypothetical protein